MKKIFYALLAGAITLTSCSKDAAEVVGLQDEATTFNLSVEAQTRASSAVTPARYVIEVWSEDGTTPENVFDNEGVKTNHKEITSGSSFTVIFDKTKAYTCLFWADDNTTYDASSLKLIGLKAGQNVSDAYFTKLNVVKGNNPTVAVTLKRAVAKVVFTETAVVKTTDNIVVTFPNQYLAFDVMAGEATGIASELTRIITPRATTGVIGEVYLLAKKDAQLSEFKFTYASELEKTISNVPYQQNYTTNIKGEFTTFADLTISVTADSNVSTPNNEVEIGAYKVGDPYPNATSPIGVVFWLDPLHPSYNRFNVTCKRGKIVSLAEAKSIVWSTEEVETKAKDLIDGRVNMATIAKFVADNGKSVDTYPVFKWVAGLNGHTTDLWAETDKWYLPTYNDLNKLYHAWNGAESGIGTDAVRNAFNAKLTAAGAEPLNNNIAYLTSEEYAALYCIVKSFKNGTNNAIGKIVPAAARAIAIFEEK